MHCRSYLYQAYILIMYSYWLPNKITVASFVLRIKKKSTNELVHFENRICKGLFVFGINFSFTIFLFIFYTFILLPTFYRYHYSQTKCLSVCPSPLLGMFQSSEFAPGLGKKSKYDEWWGLDDKPYIEHIWGIYLAYLWNICSISWHILGISWTYLACILRTLKYIKTILCFFY